MSIEDKLTETVSAIEAAGDAIAVAAARKRQTAAMADQTLALNSKNQTELLYDMTLPLRLHVENPKAHGENLTTIDTYSQSEVNSRFSNAPPYDLVPISQYGALGYLPTGAAGSFEGATSNISADSMCCPGVLEADGVMVWLRNGTNGSSRGVYYMYSAGALSGPLAIPTRTIRRYRPPFIPAGKTVRHLVNSGGEVLAGALQNATGAQTEYFVAKTGGTFDDTAHTGCFISLGVGDPIFGSHPEVFMGNTDCFIIAPVYRSNMSDPFDFKVWRITAAQLSSGTTITPTPVVTWNTTSYFGARTEANIRLADMYGSASPDAAAVLVGPRVTDTTMSVALFHDYMVTRSAQQANGSIRTRLIPHIWLADNLTGKAGRVGLSISFVWNPDTKVAAVDTGVSLPVTLAFDENQYPIMSGSVVVDSTEYYLPGSSGGFHLTSYYAPSGYWFSFAAYAVADASTHVARAKCVSGAGTLYDALHYSKRIIPEPIVPSAPVFGSAIGGSIMGSAVLPNNRLLVKCVGRAADGKTANGMVLAEKGAPNYTYLSQYSGTMSGFAPNPLRKFVHDMGLNGSQYISLVSEVGGDGSVVTTGAHFVEGGVTSVPADIDGNLVQTGTVSIPPDAMGSIRSQTYATLGIGNPTHNFMSIFVPRNTIINAFAVLTFINPANSQGTYVVELEVVGSRTGVIAGFNILSISPVLTTSAFCSGFDNTYLSDLSAYTGGITIYEGTDGYFIGGVGKNICHYLGTNGTYSFTFAIPKNTLRPDWTTFYSGINTAMYDAIFWTAVPGLGFGYNAQTNTGSDTYSKLSFRLTARNMTEFRTGGAIISSHALVTQDVAEGWLVYFTQEVPALLGGVYYPMPPQTIDLSTLGGSPANKTFYAYLTKNGNVLEYRITTEQIVETYNSMYLGTIVTDSTRITSMDINRVTRIGIYRVSSVPAGSAISHNGGPSTTWLGNARYPLLWK